MMKTKFLSLLALTLSGISMMPKPSLPPVDICGAKNLTTQHNETVLYDVFYTVAGIYIKAGEATFTNKVEKLSGRTAFHITAEGKTNDKYDYLYKVRDRYETYIDTATMEPLKFVRNIDENGHKHYENITFNQSAKTAVTDKGVFKMPDCVQDVISAVYCARNINFDNFKTDDKIPFKMFLDNEIYDMYIRYLGKEDIKTKFGKFKAIKFRPLLVKGSIFEGGEKMTVWVSDDPNHIPLRLESPIIVGSVKMDMMGYGGLKYPLSSQKK